MESNNPMNLDFINISKVFRNVKPSHLLGSLKAVSVGHPLEMNWREVLESVIMDTVDI